MKKLLVLFIAVGFASCTTTSYYQVYKTEHINANPMRDRIEFEDSNCIVSYNLWEEGGNVGFNVFNKAEDELNVLLNKTYFVRNGVAYEYFQNRTYAKTLTAGTEVSQYYKPEFWNYYNPTVISGTGSSGITTTYTERSELTIPPKTSRGISEFRITNTPYVSCDLALNPNWQKINSLKFDKSNSPFVFYNRITYVVRSDTFKLENSFYVSEITNYPSSEVFTNEYVGPCGESLNFPVGVFKDAKPDKFYIRYSR